MSIESESHPVSAPASVEAPSVELTAVGVRFELPTERILSFKEFIVRRIKRQIEYRNLWALREVDLQVRPGEIFGFVGRNGAGKSTLLKVISRVLEPTQGRVIVRGSVAPMLELGAGFHPDLTGRENVLLNATLLGIPMAVIRERLPEVMAFAELEAFAEVPARTYSSGMLARLGFSVATSVRPDILILDEVLAVGDYAFQEKCLTRLREFVSEGTTVLLVSHSLDVFARYCQRVAWIERGRIEALGSPENVIAHYVQAMDSEKG